MKSQLTFPKPRQSGYALMLTLFMVAISMTLLVSTMSRLRGDADLNARSGQYNSSLFAAEAAVERVIARMQYDYANGGENWVSNNLSAYRDFYPGADSGESSQVNGYWSNFQFSDARGNVNKTYLNVIGTERTWQPVSSQWAGLSSDLEREATEGAVQPDQRGAARHRVSIDPGISICHLLQRPDGVHLECDHGCERPNPCQW